MAVALLLFSLMGARAAEAEPSTAPATRPDAAREVLVRVIHADTGQPLPGVRAFVVVDNQSARAPLSLDDRGEARVSLPPEAREVRVHLSREGFISTSRILAGHESDAARGGVIAAAQTIRMRPGVPVGGVVRDEAGKPVAGVKMSITYLFEAPDAPFGRGLTHDSATTDAAGRWASSGAPPETNEVSVYASHPDFVLASFSQPRGDRIHFDAMRESRHRSTIRRGLSVAGVLLDEAAHPVANAEVGPDGLGLISCVKTDAAGRFQLRGVEAGERTICAIADGFAPRISMATIGPKMAPLELRLEQGRRLRALIVDERGAPIPKAAVTLESWSGNADQSGGRHSFLVGTTGADGRVVWNGAPAGPLMLGVYAADRPELNHLSATAGGDTEYRWTMPPYPKVQGVVTDEAGAPITAGKVRVTARKESGLVSSNVVPVTEGKYAQSLRIQGDSYVLRAEAEGYLPAESPALAAPEGEQALTHTFRLKRGEPTTGVVLCPDGKPAARAAVMLIDQFSPVSVNGVFDATAKRENPTSATDAAGRFTLPPRGGDKPAELIILHETGWTEAPTPVGRWTGR